MNRLNNNIDTDPGSNLNNPNINTAAQHTGTQYAGIQSAPSYGAPAGYYQPGTAAGMAPPGTAPVIQPGGPHNMAPPGAVPGIIQPGGAQNMPVPGAAGNAFASRFVADVPEKQPASAEKKSGKGKKRTAKSYMISFFIKLGVTAAVLTLLLTVFMGIFVCHDNNAYPMIKDGDLCLTYRLSRLSQGDEIAYRAADDTVRFGRVIAFGGDVVEIGDNIISVNDYAIFDATVYPTGPEGSTITYPYTVPDGCVFVLNDYRGDITDSRTVGAVPVSRTKGRVFLVMRRRGI